MVVYKRVSNRTVKGLRQARLLKLHGWLVGSKEKKNYSILQKGG